MPTSELVAAPHPGPLPALMETAAGLAMRGERETVGEDSRIPPVLAPHADLLLHGPVGEREQHALVVGLVHHRLPARHHEDIPRAPDELILADESASAALNCREHGGVG